MSLRQSLIDTGKYLLTYQLAWGTSGNMSARIDDQFMFITASGTFMGNLAQDDFAKCRIDTGEWVGERRPSKEIPMHSGIYQQRPDAKVILHSSPFYTTLFACSEEPIISELFIETMYYLEHIAYADYHHPGSQGLGEAVREQALNANVIMMRNHGVIVFDDNVADCVMRLETLEMACRMILQAKQAGIRLSKIPDQTVREFLENGNYKPRKRLPRREGEML